MLLYILAGVILLIALNALYVAAEFSAVSVRKSAVKQLASEGDSFAKRLLPILEDGQLLDRYVATCQIGITLTSLLLGAFAEFALAWRLSPVLAETFSISPENARSASVVIILISLTSLQMVVAELVPKTLALLFPARVAILTYLPMAWSIFLFRRLITFFNGCGALILKAFGFQSNQHRHIHTSAELAILLDQVHEEGVLQPDEHARLQRALSLDAWSAAELMVPRRAVHAIDRRASIDQIARQIAESPFTRHPVYDGHPENVILLLHTKDVVAQIANHGKLTSLEPVLRPLHHVPELMKADKLLNFMRRKRVHMVSVVDEYGTFVGIVTVEDVLSEVFGAIGDEFKAGEAQAEILEDGRVRLPGQMRPDEAQRWNGTLWKTEANTISGLVMETLKALPTQGDRLVIEGREVEVEEVQDRVVRSILVQPLKSTGEDKV